MAKDIDYQNMKRMIANLRDPLLLEEVLGDKSGMLQQQVMDANNDDKIIQLDNNKTAKVITDANEDVPDRILNGLETVLNGFIEAIQGAVTNIELMTVHMGDSSMVIMIKVVLVDGQPASLHIDSESQHIQLKYDNFLALDDENVRFIAQAKNYFNPRLMSQLQGVVTIPT